MGVKIEITLNAAILSKLGGKLFFYWLFFVFTRTSRSKKLQLMFTDLFHVRFC